MCSLLRLSNSRPVSSSLPILNSTLFSSSHVTAMLKTEKLPSEGQKPAAPFGVPHTSVTDSPAHPGPACSPSSHTTGMAL